MACGPSHRLRFGFGSSSAHLGDHEPHDPGVGEDVPHAHDLVDPRAEGDHVAELHQHVAAAGQVMLDRPGDQRDERVLLPRGDQCVTRDRHTVVQSDHREIERHPGQDHDEAR